MKSHKTIGYLIGLFVSACIMFGCQAQGGKVATSTKAAITINMPGTSSSKAYLIGTLNDQRFQLDSAAVDANGSLTFTKSVPYPMGFFVAYYDDGTVLQFLLDEDQEFVINTKPNEPALQAEVSGSVANQLLFDNLRFENEQQPKFDLVKAKLRPLVPGTPAYEEAIAEQQVLIDERKEHLRSTFAAHPNNFYTKFKRAGQNPDLRTDLVLPDGSPDNALQVYYYRRDFWENVDMGDTNLLRTPVITNKLDRYMTQLTAQNADSIITAADQLMERVLDEPDYFKYFANWITLKYEPGNTPIMDGEAVFTHMIQNYFTPERAFWSDSMTVYGLQQRAREMSKSLMGLPGPNVSVPGLDGTPKTLYDETAPYVVVFMYNPTCEHCLEETPKLLDFFKSRNPRDVAVYAIAIDTEQEAWRNFVDQFGIGDVWTNVFDPTNRTIYGTYYVDHTPELYLLNPARTIIGKNLHPDQIETVIQRDQERAN